MDNKIIGVELYTVREFCKTCKDISESIKKIAQIGYKSIEIAGLGAIEPKELAKIAFDNGLIIAATHIKWHRFLNELDSVIEEHKIWNCNHPGVGSMPSEYISADGLTKLLDDFAPIGEKLQREGMDFSYHNHNYEFARYGNKPWIELLLEKTNPEQFKIELDTYWVQAGGGDPSFWIYKCSGRLPILHLKDMTVTSEGRQRFAEVGEGNLNWLSIFNSAVAAGVKYYMVEQDDCYERNPFDSLKISYNNLCNLFY